MTTALLVLAAILAVGDWLLVARGGGTVRWITKPGTMIALIATALTADVGGAVQTWLVIGLVLSLVGDAFLLLAERWFVAGLAAFLSAHLAYVVGMLQLDRHGSGLLAGVGVVAAAWLLVGRTIVAGAARTDPKLHLPVVLYVVVISAMLVVAGATGEPWLVAAAGLFYVSDATLGTNRFAVSKAWMPVTVMVTYHLAQAGFVGYLLTR